MDDLSPGSLSRRSLLLGGLMVSASAAASGLQLRSGGSPPISRPLKGEFPRRIGDWTAAEAGAIVRPAEAGTKSRYDQEVSSVYLAPDRPGIMLLVAYGSTQSDTLQVHRPEFCYPAAGFRLMDSRAVTQPVASNSAVPARFFTAIRGERVEQVLYWVRLGEYFPDTWIEQHVSRMKNSIRGLKPDGILVRASVIDRDATRSHALLSDFLKQLAVQSSPVARTALLGRS